MVAGHDHAVFATRNAVQGDAAHAVLEEIAQAVDVRRADDRHAEHAAAREAAPGAHLDEALLEPPAPRFRQHARGVAFADIAQVRRREAELRREAFAVLIGKTHAAVADQTPPQERAEAHAVLVEDVGDVVVVPRPVEVVAVDFLVDAIVHLEDRLEEVAAEPADRDVVGRGRSLGKSHDGFG